jgi:hypothetical protein
MTDTDREPGAEVAIRGQLATVSRARRDGGSPLMQARYAAAVAYAALHTDLDQASRDAFALAYAVTVYPAPSAYWRAVR